MTRFIQHGLGKKQPKEKSNTRKIAAAGKYTAKDLQAKGVKSGLWEKKDG